MQQQTRGKQSMDYYSPAAARTATTRMRFDPYHHIPATRSFLTTTQSKQGYCTEEGPGAGSSRASRYSIDKNSSDMVGAGERHTVSSLGSCPTTPSPICSPMSCRSPPPQLLSTDDPSFATPNQSSCVKSNDAEKEVATPGEIKQGSRKDCGTAPSHGAKHSDTKKKRKMIIEEDGASKKRCSAVTPKPGLKEIQRREPEDGDAFGMTSKYHDDDRRLPTDEEQEKEWRYNQNHCPATSFHFSGSNGGDDSRGYRDSDLESLVEERIALRAVLGRVCGFGLKFAAETRRNKLEGKLIAWKEARTMKLMDNLTRKEGTIEQMEKKKVSKAEMEMKEKEMKLEKKRERELNKMQRRIRGALKEARRKKAKEREATSKKTAELTQAFEKMAITGKLPWCF